MVARSSQVTRPLKDGSDALEQTLLPSNRAEAIRSIVRKYSYKWTDRKISPEVRNGTTKERVVITGTTGALGSYLLAMLLESDNVGTVWALNRKSKEGLLSRQKASFEDKMLDVNLLGSAKLVMLEWELEDARLGLKEDVYQIIQTSATAIIHNAWQINYKLNLQALEPSIRGTRRLLDLAFSSPQPPRFLFTSSTTAAGYGAPNRPMKEDYLTPEDCIEGLGYGESKLATELLMQSARAAGLETCVVRLGQLTGENKSGAWSPTEWVSSIIASSVSSGYIPAAIGGISWIPIDLVARIIVDATITRGEILPPVINASHPRPVKWDYLMNIFMDVLGSRGYTFSAVPFREWNERVVSAASKVEDPKSNSYKRFPTTRIPHVFVSITHADEALRNSQERLDGEAYIGTSKFELHHAMRLSPSLRVAPSLGKEYVEKWVSYWEKKGLFSSSGSRDFAQPTLQHERVYVPRARL